MRTATFDYSTDTAIDDAVAEVPSRAVLIIDGVFLLRPVLRSAWALSVYLHVSSEESMRRGRERDGASIGWDVVHQLYRERYLLAQSLYTTEVDPRAVADIVLDNGDVTRPQIVHRNSPA